jgi:hypothetical protein
VPDTALDDPATDRVRGRDSIVRVVVEHGRNAPAGGAGTRIATDVDGVVTVASPPKEQ